MVQAVLTYVSTSHQLHTAEIIVEKPTSQTQSSVLDTPEGSLPYSQQPKEICTLIHSTQSHCIDL
jgi:hypothetical protein